MPMKIVFYYPNPEKAQQWAAQLVAQDIEFDAIFWQAGQTVTADYAIVWLPPDDFFTSVRGLQAVFNMGAGVDALLKNPHLPPELAVIRLDDAEMGLKMTEYVLHAIANMTRQLDKYAQLQAEKVWPSLTPYPYFEDWPIGIMGFGRVGQQMAHTLRSLGYPVQVWSRSAKSAAGIRCHHGQTGLSDFLQATKILINVLPLTPETTDILNTQTLSLLQAGSYLINIGRGHHVDDHALLQALDSKHMAGAVLDVFRTEPLPSAHPFWDHPAIRVTPHISGPTHATKAMQQIAQRIRAQQAGLVPEGIINRQTGY